MALIFAWRIGWSGGIFLSGSPNVTLKQWFLLGFSQILPRGTIKFASARSLRPSGHAAGIYQGLAGSQEIQTSQREEGEGCHSHPVRYAAWFWPVSPLDISLSAEGHSPRASPFPFFFPLSLLLLQQTFFQYLLESELSLVLGAGDVVKGTPLWSLTSRRDKHTSH